MICPSSWLSCFRHDLFYVWLCQLVRSKGVVLAMSSHSNDLVEGTGR